MDQVLLKKVFKGIYEVSDELGTGFLEKVYQNALAIALLDDGFQVEKERQLEVHFRGKIVGQYYADVVVNRELILELKSVKALAPEHSAQLIHYLKATGIKHGLLVNFGSKPPELKRLFG